MLDFTGTYTDQYQLTMGQVYFLKGHTHHTAVFDYFFRKLPFEGGYAVFAGLENLLEILKDLRFDEKDIQFLKQLGLNKDYIEYLKDFRFTGTVYSMREGEVVFPTEPVVRIEANIIEAQIIETLLLNILNFQTLIATKASRMRLQAKGKMLIDFGLRRAQGAGGYHASRAAVIGGFEATSNTRAGRDFDLPVSGTMAHSYIQSYEDELSAFRDFAEAHPENTVLLVDTYNTLKSGIPNAIKVGKEMEQKGQKLKGIRLDSGDLAYLSRRSREMLDEAGLDYVKIAASNQLDEHLIKSLLDQEAPIDIFGVGTSLVTGQPDAALDGVYKLAFFKEEPRIKLSETISKITLPHKKQVFRVLDKHGNFAGSDVVALSEEENPQMMFHPSDPLKHLSVGGHQKEPLLQKVMENGKILNDSRSLKEIEAFSRERLDKLPKEYKRFFNPHIYKVGLSEDLKRERDRLIDEHKVK
ncbi:nicotinate phosphoribosyltransferase [Salinimicrobium catena]|uniref:Nicotinate phosphoribosyltransferase n=1 Tax=Salinimicrobium catena TaxID=390640 RepID=A0A1H5MB98_9FLAO|nr:nicotinate phosphoribosyltransferase [Salinimicrobium catena]SDL20163.1 nicotinate phosphoribosyltransferase [Salinimicrobium catena]SEE85708.1 nicotinate phosphoribosyltransferase [Salinimicrobium catena]